MMSKRPRTFVRSALYGLTSFVLVFAVVAFIVTSSFLLFFSSMELDESDVRKMAPIVFYNLIIITAVLLTIDAVRRRLTVDRSAREIQSVLERLMNGDFSARVSVSSITGKYSKFGAIAESINLLACELAGVETLRTDFVANVSHELKTPLSVMQNYGTMLQQPGLSEEKRAEYAKSITDASRRLANLVTNILKLNRLENQQIFPAGERYDLGEQLCECLLQFESEWEKKGIDIETDIAEDVGICADAELLSLVWNNLLSNAFKFTGRGGRVWVALAADDTHATVRIADTGCGMTSEVGAHIFEKFYQGDTSHATQGNGLGLALVKRVVDIMRGDIQVESAVGKGSTFTAKIPRRLHEETDGLA